MGYNAAQPALRSVWCVGLRIVNMDTLLCVFLSVSDTGQPVRLFHRGFLPLASHFLITIFFANIFLFKERNMDYFNGQSKSCFVKFSFVTSKFCFAYLY